MTDIDRMLKVSKLYSKEGDKPALSDSDQDLVAKESRKQNVCNIAKFAPKNTLTLIVNQQNFVLDKMYNNNDKSTKFTSNLVDILIVARLDGRIRVFFYENQ